MSTFKKGQIVHITETGLLAVIQDDTQPDDMYLPIEGFASRLWISKDGVTALDNSDLAALIEGVNNLGRNSTALKAENERLRAALEETRRERDDENCQKRQVHLAYMMTVEQLALAVGLQTIEGKSTQDLIEMVKELRQSSMDFMGAYTALSQLQDSAREINLSPEDWDIAYDRLNDAKDKVCKALVPATALEPK